MLSSQNVIDRFNLVQLEFEGGYFCETFRSAETFAPSWTEGGQRSVSTAIFYLLRPDTFSALHRLPGVEVFHFYAGDEVELGTIAPDGSADVVRLSNSLEPGTTPQFVIPGGTIQGSRLKAGGEWALMGTTMSPGFDLADFHLVTRAELEELGHAESELFSSLCAG